MLVLVFVCLLTIAISGSLNLFDRIRKDNPIKGILNVVSLYHNAPSY